MDGIEIQGPAIVAPYLGIYTVIGGRGKYLGVKGGALVAQNPGGTTKIEYSFKLNY